MTYNGSTPPPRPRDPDRRRGPARSFAIGAGIAAGVTAGFAILLLAAGAWLAHGINGMGISAPPRRHLRPIPIAKTACPAVALMHKTAFGMSSDFGVLGLAIDDKGHVSRWPKARARILRATNRFDFAILASTPQFPPRVQHYLRRVHADLAAGRAKLARTHDVSDLAIRTFKLYDNGQQAFGLAGDLIGKQCPVPLGV
jgi:hypothetical protein